MQVGIITVSDRASEGVYEDLGGPALRKAAEGYGWSVAAEAIVPDDTRRIQETISSFSAQGCALILTTGGTGIAERDVTPEAIRGIMRVEIPGFGELPDGHILLQDHGNKVSFKNIKLREIKS